MIRKLRHIGIIVNDIDSAVHKFEGFGLRLGELIERKELGMKNAFFPLGDTILEFLSFQSGKELNAVQSLLRSQKGAINHLCFEVENLEESIRDFQENGAKIVEGGPRSGAHGRIAFFYPETTDGVLIELCEV